MNYLIQFITYVCSCSYVDELLIVAAGFVLLTRCRGCGKIVPYSSDGDNINLYDKE